MSTKLPKANLEKVALHQSLSFFNPYVDSLDIYINKSLTRCSKFRLNTTKTFLNVTEVIHDIYILAGRG